MTTPTDRNPAIRTITDRITMSDGAEVATTTIETTCHDNDQGRLGEVIICHGTPWSSRMWLPLARQLARHIRIRLWDMPGYGESFPDLSDTSAQPTDIPFAEALPRRPHVTRFPRSGHLVPVEAPHDLLTDVTAWLDG
ncbi:alpha/beta fold hydrolase [Brevibacterium permense]|uniref:alpha/beta fold hydrolase n=1 Tax=Brevibacterium permense TaxID=234834 RepID=UPI0021D23C63|nr:alpha/beta hydrolase [Brevibacterium permense]